MKGKVSLKKEITDILDNAKLVENRKSGHTQVSETDMYVTHRVNEQGYECTYYFGGESSKEMLLKRAASLQREMPMKFKEWQNGNRTQNVMLFLKENKEALQALIDIDYLMRTYNYDVQKACGILFKDKKTLPSCFRLESKNKQSKAPLYSFDTGAYFGNRNIEYLIDIVRILPKSYLKEIEDDVGSNDK